VDITAYPFVNILLSFFLLFIWVSWIFIWIRLVADVLRRHDIGGGYKACWIVLLIFVPLISALVYILMEGNPMADREASAPPNRYA
jgi:hypothetical protein